MIRARIFILLCVLSLPLAAQDYEREKRWSEQIVAGLVVGDAVWIEGPHGRKFLGLFTAAARPRASLLLVHGVGVHPDHGVIGALRASLSDTGYTTLSVQMPVLGAEATPRDYRAVFPNAIERIRAAAAWLHARGPGRIVLVSHSMGSWMSNEYYAQTPAPPFAAWVCMGLTGGYASTRNVKVPLLDVYAENDLPNVLRADWRRRMTVDSITGGRQVRIAGADHFYTGKEKELTAVIDAFIREQVLK